MKKIIFAMGLLSALLIGQVTTVAAHTPNIGRRQMNQHYRIEQGMRSGELTRRETHNLRMGERRIQQDKMMARVDGRMSFGERRHIMREQDRMSRNIFRDKHNDRVRF